VGTCKACFFEGLFVFDKSVVQLFIDDDDDLEIGFDLFGGFFCKGKAHTFPFAVHFYDRYGISKTFFFA
jgi:hypothetical protein